MAFWWYEWRHMDDVIRIRCREISCLELFLVNYFGFWWFKKWLISVENHEIKSFWLSKGSKWFHAGFFFVSDKNYDCFCGEKVLLLSSAIMFPLSSVIIKVIHAFLNSFLGICGSMWKLQQLNSFNSGVFW